MKKIKILFGHWQALLLLPAAFFLWYAIDGFYGYSVEESDLKSFIGEVNYIAPLNTKDNRVDINTAILKLSSYQDRAFILKDRRLINDIFQKIKIGDNINVFTIPRLYDKPNSSPIVKVLKGNELILDLYLTSKKVSLNIALMFTFFFLLVFIPYILKVKKLLFRKAG